MTRTHSVASTSSSRGRSSVVSNSRKKTCGAAPLGKKDLLAWACETSGVYPCSRLAHLGDGLVLLGLAQRLYPQRIRRDRLTAQHRGKARAAENWSLLLQCMTGCGIPTCVTDPESIAQQTESDCLNSLVLFYFLLRLARSEDFTVDFAFPVDARVAAFLQSPASLVAVGKASAVGDARSSPEPTRANERGATNKSRRQGAAEAERHPRASSLQSRRSTENAWQGTVSGSKGAHLSTASSRSSSESSREPSSPSVGSSPSATASADDNDEASDDDAFLVAMRKKMQAKRSPRVEETPSVVESRSPEHDDPSASRCGLSSSPMGESKPTAAGLDLAVSTDVHALRIANALLREELRHATAQHRLAEVQHQGELEVGLSRAAEDSAVALARLKLTHAHELARLRLGAGLGSDAPTLEEPLEQLQLALAASEERFQAFADKMRSFFAAMTAVVASPVDPNRLDAKGKEGATSLAAHYEEAVVDSIETQLRSDLPPALFGALSASLRSLLSNLNTLRAANARLQWEGEHHAEVFGPANPSSSECASGDDAIAREQQQQQQQQQQLRRELEAARRSVETLKRSLAESQRQNRERQEPPGFTQADVDAITQRWAARLRASEERYATLDLHARLSEEKATRDATECRKLYDKVASLIAHFCSTDDRSISNPDDRSHRWNTTASGLKEALNAWVKDRGSLDAMEAALQEQCETIATLRRRLRQLEGGVTEERGSAGQTDHQYAPPAQRDAGSETHTTSQPERTLPVCGEGCETRCAASPPHMPTSPPSGLLSPAELERRKRAILAKYAQP